MALETSIGIAHGESSQEAGRKAAQMALADEKIESPDLAIIFSSVVYNGENVLKGVRSALGESVKIVGSSTAGEITTSGASPHHSVSVMLFQSDSIQFFTGAAEDIANSGSYNSGQNVAQEIKDQADVAGVELKSFIMFPDVLTGNGARIVEGVLDVLGSEFPVVGGASGDDQKFEKTFQYHNDQMYSGSVVAVGLSGDFEFGVGVRHGWIPIGAPMIVTKSKGSVIYEIDNKPAISVYEDHFGKENATLLKEENVSSVKSVLTYPFGVHTRHSAHEGHRDEMLLRFALDVRRDGSIQCAAEIPEGSDIQLMIGSKEEAVAAAKLAAESALKGLNKKQPKAIILFNCIARKNLLGDDINLEINTVQDVIGFNVPLIGFYTYGEQAPVLGFAEDIKRCETSFHNETIVIYTLG